MSDRGVSWRWSVAIGLAAAALGAAIACKANALHVASDLDEGLAAARYLATGANPYAHVGPGLTSPWPWPIYYPLPAITLLVPFSWLGDAGAHVVFLALSCGVLGAGLARTGNHRLVLFLSGAFFNAAVRTQWAPVLMAAYLWPALGFVYAAKPNIGAAFWCAKPSRAALVGSVALAGVCFALDPGWVGQWLHASPIAEHLRPAVLYPFGWLLVLAALRWRRRDARLLLLLALIPQTLAEYAALPLFLVTDSLTEAMVLLAGTYAVTYYAHFAHPATTDMGYIATSGRAIVLACFLPCLAMLLRRPNVGDVPAWLERLAARRPRLSTQALGRPPAVGE